MDEKADRPKHGASHSKKIIAACFLVAATLLLFAIVWNLVKLFVSGGQWAFDQTMLVTSAITGVLMLSAIVSSVPESRQDKRRQQLIASISGGTTLSEEYREENGNRIRIRRRTRPNGEVEETRQTITKEDGVKRIYETKTVQEVKDEPPPQISFYDKITEITFEYIESYYKQTQTQAARSFILSAIASLVSFVVIVYGIMNLYKDTTHASAITVSVGAFCQFISAVFFYLYNKTVLKMSEYHQKLVMTQNVMMAIKLSENLPDDAKAKATTMLIGTLTKDINRYLSPNPSPEPAAAPSRKKREPPTA